MFLTYHRSMPVCNLTRVNLALSFNQTSDHLATWRIHQLHPKVARHPRATVAPQHLPTCTHTCDVVESAAIRATERQVGVRPPVWRLPECCAWCLVLCECARHVSISDAPLTWEVRAGSCFGGRQSHGLTPDLVCALSDTVDAGERREWMNYAKSGAGCCSSAACLRDFKCIYNAANI